jgi:hypothetical protein
VGSELVERERDDPHRAPTGYDLLGENQRDEK